MIDREVFNSFSGINKFILVSRDEEGSASNCVMPFRLDTRRKSVVSGIMSGAPGTYTLHYQLKNLRVYAEAPVRCGIAIVAACSEELASFAIFGHNETKRQGIYRAELQIDGAGYARPDSCRRFDIGRDDCLEIDLQFVVHEQDNFGVCHCNFIILHDRKVLVEHGFKKSVHAEWYAFCHATENQWLDSFNQDRLCAKVDGRMAFKEQDAICSPDDLEKPLDSFPVVNHTPSDLQHET